MEAFSEAELALQSMDPVLGAEILRHGPIYREPNRNYFLALCRSIISQQVSVAAGSAIFGRFQEATELKPLRVLDLTEELRLVIGLSKQKHSYLTDLARHFVDDPAVYDHLDTQTDEQVLDELTAVRGIGVWTAQMFLMSSLLRPDIFAADDVGLQRAVRSLYGGAVASKQDLERFSERWRPYRSAASWHLWRSLENDPTS